MDGLEQRAGRCGVNRFPRVMAVRLGYDPAQVDEFVRRIERTLGLGPLDGPPVTADEIRNARFAVKRKGYNETAVDFALDAFIVAVEARGDRDTATPAPKPPTTPAVPPPTAPVSKPPLTAPAVPAPPAASGATGSGSAAPEASDEEFAPAVRWPAGQAAAGTSRSAASAPASADVSRPTGASGPVGQAAAGTSRSAASAAVSRPTAAPASAAPLRRTPAEDRARPQTPSAKAAVGAGREERTGTLPPEPGSPSWLETQAARVERVAFRPGRLGMGYREEEVDDFLDRIVATLRGTAAEPLTAEQVRKATFATVVFRPGYAVGEVDGFLADMANVLERRP
ncbi:DivIVA domain-containing protein [Microbispora sp. SCL1-1]|uniref:DivIVA domain-containing protein n=1 Tax=unclassified Microbispora TaxID=2614687 RepID=UPI001156D808|nr:MULTISPECIES: DivIVA domain-containing protein [unclassified Microbispora]TQS09448.1 DivIVA domain-containing protein [Microbispora sp. SCL1-1]